MTDLRARVLLLAGPSGSGKTHLAAASGLPVLDLDAFYRDGTDPDLPVDPALGIVDWDDVGAWDSAAAVAAIEQLCRTGSADVPVYDIGKDRRVGQRPLDLHNRRRFIATGIFAAEIVEPCRRQGLLADAVVVRRAPWKNFLRRLARDLTEHRKPPLTAMRRGLALWRTERALVERQISLGCRPCDRNATLAVLNATTTESPR